MYGVIYNPISGRGTGEDYALQISKYFISKGEEVAISESLQKGVNLDFLKSNSGLIIVGGDGTIRPYLPHLAKLKIPVILFPAGNESLVAQQFLVSRNISELFERVKRNKLTEHYFGTANEEPFFLMCSVGFDAEVVAKVKDLRKGFSSNSLYARAILGTFYKKVKSFKLQVGDSTYTVRGSLIVANSSYYGAKIKPVSDASSEESTLKYSIFQGPHLKLLLKFIFMRLGIHSQRSEGEVKELIIKLEDGNSFNAQVDGDSLGRVNELRINISKDSVLFY